MVPTFCLMLLLMLGELSCTKADCCNLNYSCGCTTKLAGSSRIVGGVDADSQLWTWAVSINIASSLCGGSIISSSYILTAAHCVWGASTSQITIYAGSSTRLAGTQNRSVSRIVIHSGYSRHTFVNDIALLLLSTPLNMTDPGVGTICLPSVNSTILAAGEWPPAETGVIAVGWGALRENGPLSPTLQQVFLRTVDHQSSTCTPVTTNWSVQLCAISLGKDTCQGDSGGPLMTLTESKQWVLIGLTSSGIGCARPNYSASYTRVAAYENWIISITGGQFANPTSSELNSSIAGIESVTQCMAYVHHQSALLFSLAVILPSVWFKRLVV